MNAKRDQSAVKALVTGLVLGGLVLTSVATAGCERMSKEQVAAFVAGAEGQAGDLLDVSDTRALHGKIAINHNETFLIGVPA